MGIADMDNDQSSYYSNYEKSEQYGIDDGLSKEWQDRVARGEILGETLGFDQSRQNLYNSAAARINEFNKYKELQKQRESEEVKRGQLDEWDQELNPSLAEKPVPLPQNPPVESKVDAVAGKPSERTG